MIKTVTLDSISGVMELISEQEYNKEIGRYRSSIFFRGLPSSDFKLTTSLKRNCKEKSQLLEPAILRNFTKYACMSEPGISSSVWRQMVLGQHHGLPTRLLDWTRSPLVALHFAHSETRFEKLESRDCAVWKFDMKDVNIHLPDKYRKPLEENCVFVYSLDKLNSIVDNLEQYDSDMGKCAFVNIEPPSIDQRIISQYSFFSVIPSGIDDIEAYLDANTEHTIKYVIKKEIRWQVRDMLDQFNINERMLYPDLDGLSTSIARHYFVK